MTEVPSTPPGSSNAPPPAPVVNTTTVSTTNGYAVAALTLGILGWTLIPFLGSIGAIIFGHIARGQIRRQPQDGDGLALAGLILGWISVGLWLIGVICFILFFGGLAALAAMNA